MTKVTCHGYELGPSSNHGLSHVSRHGLEHETGHWSEHDSVMGQSKY